MPRTLVFNGWAAGAEAWALCDFARDWVFNYLEQLEGLPERVIDGFDEVLLVGFSMGGTSALRMLLRSPEKVKGLVLVSTTPCMTEHRDEGWAGMSDHRRAALRLGTLQAFSGDPSPVYQEENLDRGLAFLHEIDLRKELLGLPLKTRTGLPVWIFQSEKDGIVRPANAVFLKEVFPNARVTLVPGSEHVLPITIPESIDEAVRTIGHEAFVIAQNGRK